MKRNLLISVAFLALFTSFLTAQEPVSVAPPLALNGYVPTPIISVPTVAGAPFSATVFVRSEQMLADGSRVTLKTTNLIGRDSRGRTHGESRKVVPDSFRGEPPLVRVIVFDPSSHSKTTYNVQAHTAERETAEMPRGGPSEPGPQVTSEDLGYSVIEGFGTKGTRRTFTIPAGESGARKPLAVVDEYWYSEDLKLNLQMRHSDPRTCVKTFTVTHINREEPPLSFFELEGYKITDTGAEKEESQ